jgi:predicted peptidase
MQMRPVQQHVFRKKGYNYLLYLPHEYGMGKKWPLIVFLHGAAEKGSNLNQLKATALPRKLEQVPDFPFVVVSPQCPSGFFWSAVLVGELLDDVVCRYKIDEERIYLTGISMGGYGTWDSAIEQPWRFAAIAPICGGGNPGMAPRIKDLPVWVFHGALDNVIPITESITMVEALKKVKGNVRLTVYPDAGHDSWSQTYDSDEIYKWFLSHSRKPCQECPEGKQECG